MTRKVQYEITKALIRGQCLTTYKTKPQVGRQSVTVGPYREAVGVGGYAVIVGGESFEHSTAISAAQDFIEYVGRSDAWAALQGRGRERNPK